MSTSPSDFEKFLLREYFRLGSINKVYTAHRHNLPISFAGFARVLTKYEVIKSAGPNSRLSESLDILTKLSSYKIPLEKVYHRYAPQTIQVSTNTLHRILHYTRLGLTRRQGTALLITPVGKPLSFLTGIEKNTPNSALGQKGDLTLPMSHSKIGESPRDAIVRVLQQEVFTDLLINSAFPWDIIPQHPRPTLFIKIADIKVTVYHLTLPTKLSFSSFRLSHLKYRSLDTLFKSDARPGVREICEVYLDRLTQPNNLIVPEISSNLNLHLYALAKAPN